MADGGSRDVLAQYRAISNKLKKRFLRKPNVTEASEQFGKLAVQCEHEELPQYAGLCWIAAARCEGSLGNSPGEAWDLVRGARQFLTAEKSSKILGCPTSGGEHLQAAVSCYAHATNRWQHHHSSEQDSSSDHHTSSPLAAGLALELGQALRVDLDRVGEAASQFRQAADLQANSPPDQINSLALLASCHIQLGDYDGALGVFNEMVSLAEYGGKPPTGMYCDILHRCEVTRVLLLLILQPTAQRLPTNLAQVLEKYTWVDEVNTPVSFLMEDEFLLLQSLVLACQSHDVESLCSLEADLWCHLSTEQRDLLRILVARISRGTK